MKTKPLPRPKKIYLHAFEPNRLAVASNAKNLIDELPVDKHFKITITEGKDSRSEAQNRLLWLWNNQLVTLHDDSYSADYYHSYNKLYVLLPMMRHDAAFERLRGEGDFIYEAMSAQLTLEHKLRIAYDCVRSSDLHAGECTLYINSIREGWLERGVELNTSHREYYQAVGATA